MTPAIAVFCLHSSPVGPLGSRDTGGMSVYVCETARHLAWNGIACDLFTLAGEAAEPVVNTLFPGVRLIRLPMPVPVAKAHLWQHIPLAVAALTAFTDRQHIRYDLVHSHYWLSGLLGEEIRNRWQIPHVMTFHTLGEVKNRHCPGESEPRRRIIQEGELALACDRIVAFTGQEKQDLVSIYGADANRITVIPCGVDFDRFRPEDRDQARQALGFSGQDRLLLYVGRFVPVKGLDRLITAVSCLDSSFRLVVAGGDEDERLSSRIRESGLENRVILAGRIEPDHLARWYAAVDMLVVPSFHESFCLCGLEALACGTPVLATSVGGLSAYVGPGSGYILENGDPGSLAEGIRRVWQGRELLPPEKIRDSVREWNWQRVARGLADVYQKLKGGSLGE